MAYSTPAMVRLALIQTTDGSQPDEPTNTAADLSDAQLNDAIAEADSTIDGYLGAYYEVPVADVNGDTPHPIDYWSRNLAIYNATIVYRGSMDFAETDPVTRRYNDTMAALQAVAAGRMRLQLPENTSGNSGVETGQVFNPYIGDLWGPEDFDLTQSPSGLTAGPFWWDRW